MILTHLGHPLIYQYELGYHLQAKQLCRILHRSLTNGAIDANCVRVIWFKDSRYLRFKYYPLDETGNLKPEYWSIYRAEDFDRRIKDGVI